MSALPSIQRRLARLLLTVALAWGLAVSAAVWLWVRHEVDELLDDTLRASSTVLLGLLQADTSTLRAGGPGVVPGPPGGERFAWQLVGPGAGVALRSAHAPPEAWHGRPTPGHSDIADRWRIYGVRFDAERTLYVAQTREERREALAEVGVGSVLAALAVGLVTTVVLRVRVRRELQPLTAMSDALARYEPLADGAALDAPTREELLPIHAAVQALAQRLASRVASERAFSAHAAHALRTPLAGIDAQLAVALRESPPPLQPRLQRVRSAAGRLGRVVTALLALFRTGVEPRREAVEVAALLARLPVEGIDAQVEPPDAVVDADPDLLAAALLNLLDNAARHGAGRVRVQVQANRLCVRDDGPGADAARRAAMQTALDGQDYDRAGNGLGLGLMLADLVARAHGGRVVLPPADTGFAVDLGLGAPVHPPR